MITSISTYSKVDLKTEQASDPEGPLQKDVPEWRPFHTAFKTPRFRDRPPVNERICS